MEQKDYTVEEVIEITINVMQQINVPVGMNQQIAVPISGCISNLRLALEAIRKKKEAEQKEDEKPGIREEEL